MHVVADDDTPPDDWPEPIPEGRLHLSILLSGDTQYRPVKELIAGLPKLLAETLPAGVKVGVFIIDDEADAKIPILDEPVICTTPNPEFHTEPCNEEYDDDCC
jgi:hypothetical protein